jgi:hypothetical protein
LRLENVIVAEREGACGPARSIEIAAIPWISLGDAPSAEEMAINGAHADTLARSLVASGLLLTGDGSDPAERLDALADALATA